MNRTEAVEVLTKMLDCEDIDFCDSDCFKCRLFTKAVDRSNALIMAIKALGKDIDVPSKEIIRCKDCKHWNLQVGNVKGDGLGSCDFHNVNLVTGEGFCYWAENRGEADGQRNGITGMETDAE